LVQQALKKGEVIQVSIIAKWYAGSYFKVV